MGFSADSSLYSDDLGAKGFLILVLCALPLILIPALLVYSPPDLISNSRPAALIILLVSFAFMAFLALYLKGSGMLFKVPLKALESGILIQPTMRMRAAVVAYDDISSLALWQGSGGRVISGCELRTSDGRTVSSVEHFRDLGAFIALARPILEDKGLMMAEPAADGGSGYGAAGDMGAQGSGTQGKSGKRFVFRRAARRPVPGFQFFGI